MIGQTLSHYVVLEQIGEGGMGVVFRAEDPRLGRQVAIKVLSPHLTRDPSSRARFLTEARAASALDHRNVCAIHDIGETPDGQMFMVMPFYDGASLRDVLADGPVPPAEAARIGAGVAAGLARAHAAGIIHRDIKPANVVVTRDGEVKILDFGIAKLADDPGLTRSGSIVGTLHYLSPEQFGGDDLDARTDLWSLGVLLYELVTGTLPFRGNGQAQTVHAILHREPNLELVRIAAGSELAGLIARCLAKDRLARPRTARHVASELEHLAATLPDRGGEVSDAKPMAGLPTLAMPSPARPRSTTARVSKGSSSGLESLGGGLGVVGRQRELARLEEFAHQAERSGVRVAFVSGEAGRGKTTLVSQLARQLGDTWLTVLGSCNARAGQGDPYHPFRDILGLLAGEVGGRSSSSRTGETQIGETRAGDDRSRSGGIAPGLLEGVVEDGPDLVGTFVSAPQLLASARSQLESHPELVARLERVVQERSKPSARPETPSTLFDQYTRVLQRVSSVQPLLIVLDDLHWVDSGSANLLLHLTRELGDAPVLLIGTYRREEVTLAAEGQRHLLDSVVNELGRTFGEIEIDLDAEEPRPFVDALLDAEPNELDEHFRAELARRTAGLPLFASELLRRFREEGTIARREDGTWVLAGPIDWRRVPRRVEAVVAERIGRLPEEVRSLLTTAGIEGEEFTAEVLAAVSGLDEREVMRRLSQDAARRHRLVLATGIRRLGDRRLSLYRFRHEIFARFLTDHLDPVERCVLHEEVAAALEACWGERVEEVSPRLAHHYLEAKIPRRAIEFLQRAAQRASLVSAHTEAIGHLRRALAELPASGFRGTEGAVLELEILTALAPALVSVHGFTAPEVQETYHRSRELCGLLPEAPELPILWGLFAFSSIRGEPERALPLARQMLERATVTGELDHRIQAHYAIGATQLLRAELGEALEHVDTAVRLGREGDGQHLALAFAMDSRAVAAAYGSVISWLQGEAETSFERAAAAVAPLRDVAHPLTLSTVLLITGLRHAMAADWKRVAAHGAEMRELSAEYGLFQTREATILEALSAANLEPAAATATALGEAITVFRAEGWSVFVPLFLGWLAERWIAANDASRAEVALDEALRIADRTGERFWLPELMRLEAVCAGLRGGSPETAQAGFEAALSLARNQGATALVRRVEADLITLVPAESLRPKSHLEG